MVEKIAIPVRDRVLAGNSMSLAVGPLADLTRQKVVDAVYAVALEGKQHRVGVLYGDDSKTLLWDKRLLREIAEGMVEEVPAMSQEELTRLCVKEANRKGATPLRFVVVGDYIIEVIDHVVFDASETFQVFKSVMQKLQNPEATLDERTLDSNPTWAAFKHTFGTDRKKVAAALDARKSTLYPAAPAGQVRQIERQDGLILGVVSAENAREVQKAARANGGTLNSMLLAAIVNRVAAEGIPFSAIRTTYDLRRWLPEKTVAGGNFIAAQHVNGTTPAEIAAQIELSNATAAPLLAATIGAVRNKVSGAKQHEASPTATHDGRMQLTFSGLGVVRTLEQLPWKSKDEHFFVGFTKPGPGGELTINAVKMKNKIYISASYNGAAYAPELMQRIFDDVAAEPVRWAEQGATAPAI
jgi:hypothetical protein